MGQPVNIGGSGMDKSIEYILEVARCRGITKAAENLFITPSALSKYIISKERELGLPLFHRVGKEFVPTTAGEHYITRLKEIQLIERKLDDEMLAYANLTRGILQIGIQASFIEALFRDIMPAFEKQLPGVRLYVNESTLNMFYQKLRQKQIDMVLSMGDLHEDGIESQVIKEGQFVIATAHPEVFQRLAVEKEGFSYPWIDSALLADVPMVGLRNGSVYQERTDKILEANGIHPSYAYQVMSTRSGLTCIENTDASMVTVDTMVLNNSFRKKIHLFSFGEAPATLPLTLSYPADSMLKSEIESMADICRKYIK